MSPKRITAANLSEHPAGMMAKISKALEEERLATQRQKLCIDYYALPLMREAIASTNIDSGTGAMVTHSDFTPASPKQQQEWIDHATAHASKTFAEDFMRATTPPDEPMIYPGPRETKSARGSRYETVHPTEAEIAEFRKPREKPADAPHAPNAGVSDQETVSPDRAFFRVYGDPVGQPRIQVTKSGHAYTPDKKGRLKAWKSAIRSTWTSLQAWKFDGPTYVGITFLFPRPKSMKDKRDCRIRYTQRPDRDNTDKTVLDALTDAPKEHFEGAWADDKIVCDGPIRKFWCARDETPGAIIDIRSLKDTEEPE